VPWELGLALPAPVRMVATNERDLGSQPRGVAERKRAASHLEVEEDIEQVQQNGQC
jgi:hypothetical protein